MKTNLRRIGNSSGITFTREVLAIAGFSEGQELVITAVHGEIRLVAVDQAIEVEFSNTEARALIHGDLASDAGQSAINKLRDQIHKLK